MAQESTVTLPEVLRHPRDPTLRAVLLLLTTFCAGWTDALTYVRLGHVFSSFMTGNTLFIGLSAVHGDRALLVRAVVSLLLFLAGSTLGTLFLGRLQATQTRHVWRRVVAGYLAIEALVLFGFACGWQLSADLETNDRAQITLLGVAAFAMGAQGALVQTFEIPGVVADALTGTLLQLGKRFAETVDAKERSHPLHGPLLIALCLTYLAAAVAVTLTISWPGRPFVPAVVVTIVIFTLLASRERERSQALTT